MRKSYFLCGTSALSMLSAMPCMADETIRTSKETDERPNIVLIMADDMGYSDVGCYGGEIPTPNIDRLAQKGVRYTQFYNSGRSCPTRASLLTGLYPQQAGIGAMSEDPGIKKGEKHPENRGVHGYMGFLNRNCVTIAEVLKEAGYHTYMTGKWHVGMHGKEKWPLQRGFEHFYGILAGASSYLKPQGGRGLTLDNTNLPAPQSPYYTTDAFTDYAIRFIDEQTDDNPFFLYLAYNAPHWPLHTKDKDLEKFAGKYDKGWEAVREERYRKMVELGIVNPDWKLAEWESRAWNELTEAERDSSSLRMSVYAAQVYCMDYNIGKLIDYLEEEGKLDNTLILFLSDNGACVEPYSEKGFGSTSEINKLDSWVHPSYGLPWAQVSNTPYRKYKVRAYEGGIATPLIISWPEVLGKYSNQIRRNVGFVPDIMATFVEVARAEYPTTYHDGNSIIPMAGTSLMSTVHNPDKQIHEYIFGEHFNNCFVRWKNWKAVKDEKMKEWELYDIEKDRTEWNNVAAEYPDVLKKMVRKWEEWANECYIFPKRLN